jgi:hypothetical protein
VGSRLAEGQWLHLGVGLIQLDRGLQISIRRPFAALAAAKTQELGGSATIGEWRTDTEFQSIRYSPSTFIDHYVVHEQN